MELFFNLRSSVFLMAFPFSATYDARLQKFTNALRKFQIHVSNLFFKKSFCAC